MGADTALVKPGDVLAERFEIERARVAIAGARDRLLRIAERITDPALRRSFLESVPENARTLRLSRAWLGS